MNLQLWFRLFINQVFIGLVFIGLVLGVCFFYVPGFEWGFLYTTMIWQVRLFVWLIGLVIALSALYSLHISLALNNTYELIRAKVNWLLLGKYHHPIFNQEVKQRSWYDNDSILSQDIDRLRERLVLLTQDLQEYSAAPIFVGQETKEEIIEKERSRIARELHDSVSQQLFAAMMMLSAITESYDERENPMLARQLKKVEAVIGNAQVEMRALLLHLRPVDLQGKSLKQGITSLLLELKEKIPLQLTWVLDDPKLETGIEDHLFRIVQEAISNTMRHANASHLEVYLRENRDTITIRIVDDGRGFDVKASHKLGSYGLQNMQERVQGMGGNLAILSSPNQGTVVTVKVPFKPIQIPEVETEKEQIHD